MDPGTFGDRARMPTDGDLTAALGLAMRHWRALEAALAAEHGPAVGAWTFGGTAQGWSYGLKRRGRAIAYLTPLEGRFRASLAVPERAMPAALAAELPAGVRAIVVDAPANIEGRAVRIEVTSDDDVAAVLALVRIRMAS